MEVGKVQLGYHGANNRWAWLGITDRSSQGSYRYESDNGDLTTSRWHPGEPNSEDEHCVHLCASAGNWCNRDCSVKVYTLCERTY